MNYYFEYVRKNSEGKENRIARYSFNMLERTIYAQQYVDGKLLDHKSVVQSDVVLKDFKDYRNNKVNLSSFANVTKIKGDKPLKRILHKKDGKLYCKESDEKSFEFNDKMLNEDEKKYIMEMGE